MTTRSPSSSRSGWEGLRRKRFLDVAFATSAVVECGICQRPITARIDASVDHVIEVSIGGDEHPENYRPAHRTCNNWRSNPRKKARIE